MSRPSFDFIIYTPDGTGHSVLAESGLPIDGHWLKRGWGYYYKNSKRNKIPGIPGI